LYKVIVIKFILINFYKKNGCPSHYVKTKQLLASDVERKKKRYVEEIR